MKCIIILKIKGIYYFVKFEIRTSLTSYLEPVYIKLSLLYLTVFCIFFLTTNTEIRKRFGGVNKINKIPCVLCTVEHHTSKFQCQQSANMENNVILFLLL